MIKSKTKKLPEIEEKKHSKLQEFNLGNVELLICNYFILVNVPTTLWQNITS